MSLRDLISGEAELGDDDDDEQSFDEETGEPRAKKSRNGDADMDDSSEEEEDDDDEEEARRIREGFIVDEDEDDEPEAREKRRKRDKKRRRQEREEEEAHLDEEDLDLIGEAIPDWQREAATQPKLKRLKRGHREDDDRGRERGLDDIFSDDEADGREIDARHPSRPDRVDEFADFIEEDEADDEDDRLRMQEEREIAAPRAKAYIGSVGDSTGIDKDALEDMQAIFGDGEDYDWALELEDAADQTTIGEGQLELKDVFEPSQLKEKLLTDEDNHIRWTDEPERFQLDRAPYKHIDITDEQFKEEAKWITDLLWPKKRELMEKANDLKDELKAPFQAAIGKVLEFFVVDALEVPYVFQHRKDYLIHAVKISNPDHERYKDQPAYIVAAEKLLNQDDLWRIMELDLKFRAFIDKRNNLEKLYDNLKQVAEIADITFEDMLPQAVTAEELQDLQEYLSFQYAAEIADLKATESTMEKTQRRPGGRSTLFDRIRKSRAYQMVRAYGITADQFASNALRQKKHYTEDTAALPIDLADSLTDAGNFSTGDQVILAARQMFAEEIFVNPKMRQHFRRSFYALGVVSCRRTEKGLRKIDEQHQYYELKYLQNLTIMEIVTQPDLFLRMLKAEEEGLLEVRIHLENGREFRRQLINEISSDNYSELADAWNEERAKVVDLAIEKLNRFNLKGVKEGLRAASETVVLSACRTEYFSRLDQAPLKPKGMMLGTIPRVLALTNGDSDPGRDVTNWAWVEDDGRVLEHGKFDKFTRNEEQREMFVELVQRRKPDVIGISGWGVDTHKLIKDIVELVESKKLSVEVDDPDGDEPRQEPLEVVIVNDEVARLYKDSPRALADLPLLPSQTRYCVALAKYLQNPMKEYAALGTDIVSLSFHPCQHLVPEERLRKQLDTAMVDIVNLCGIDINDAVNDPYTANLLPYVCGLGPRKATAVIKAINVNGGFVNTRDELVGDPDSGKVPVVGPRVWNNCASFMMIEYDPTQLTSDYLDNTRVHPEDYELGRKMAGDALELDEEDIKAEQDENGPGAVVRKLIKDEEQEKVNDLVLEEYAEQLETNYNQRKRATLETIRAELQQPYEELRRNFAKLGESQVFTMFTGETKATLCEDMIVSVVIRVVKDDFIIAKLDSGLEGRVESYDVSDNADAAPNRLFAMNQTARARVIKVDRKDFQVTLSLRESQVNKPYRKYLSHGHDQWDIALETRDKEELREKDKVTGRTQRVVKHPLFRPFNSVQAEQYLGSKAPGDAVIRPSSKGNDHLAVTWKVADGVYQHIDVLELMKDNEYTLGKVLRIGGKYNYSDLDELIDQHVKSMSKKVDELMQHEKYQSGTRNDTEKWLTTYTEANPKRSVYAFCLDTKHPGYFYLCFKAGQNAKVAAWNVKVIPKAFEMLRNTYPDMRALCNGFKLSYQTQSVQVSHHDSGRNGNGRY